MSKVEEIEDAIDCWAPKSSALSHAGSANESSNAGTSNSIMISVPAGSTCFLKKPLRNPEAGYFLIGPQ